MSAPLIKVAMTARGVSARDLAKRVGIKSRTLSDIIAGRFPPSSWLRGRLAKALGVRSAHLLWKVRMTRYGPIAMAPRTRLNKHLSSRLSVYNLQLDGHRRKAAR